MEKQNKKPMEATNNKFLELQKKHNVKFKYEKGFEFCEKRFKIVDYVIDDFGKHGYEILDREKHELFPIQEIDLNKFLSKYNK